MNEVAMKFLGTTTVTAPIVLIILMIWMAFAFASPARSDSTLPASRFQRTSAADGALVDLDELNACRWPIGDPPMSTFRYCAGPRQFPGIGDVPHFYCEGHAETA